MFRVWLTFSGVKDGRAWFCTRTDIDVGTVTDKLEKGDPVTATITQPRSIKHQAYFFVKMQKVFENLPEGDDRFDTSERLRKWLSCKAGWCDRQTFTISNADEIEPILRSMQRQSDDLFFAIIKDRLIVVRAKSLNFAAMDKQEFIEFDEAIDRVIQKEFGIDPQALMAESAQEGRS